MQNSLKIAVLIPCFNEALTIAAVISDFRTYLPAATIYVYDNNSTDGSAEVARANGAIVRHEARQGKGHVIRRMFADIESDIYVMTDGDSTYPAASINAMIELLRSKQLDMVIGTRVPQPGAFRPKHALGNKAFNWVVAKIFGHGMSDIFSGYRVFSRRFVKTFPALSGGFDIETEISVHTLDLGIPFAELPVPYLPRPEGSHSKLRTYHDGLKILMRILVLFKDVKPLRLFSLISVLLLTGATLLGYPVARTFAETGLVPRFPTAILVIGMTSLAIILFAMGLVLESAAQLKRENKRMSYLSHPRS